MKKIDDKTPPGKDPLLISEEDQKVIDAIKVLDKPGQRILGQMLTGRKTVDAAQRINSGEVEVLTSGVITDLKRKDSSTLTKQSSSTMHAAMKLAGIDSEFLATILYEGLAANKLTTARVNRNGKTKNTSKMVPDYAIRIRYLELAHRLRGDLVPTKDGKSAELGYAERIRVIMNRNRDDVIDVKEDKKLTE
jgi:hypothetical protein